MITTGPGLISPIATASTNCCCVSQPLSSTRPACRNGTTASPDPNVSAPALKKNQPSEPKDDPEPVHAKLFTAASTPTGEPAAVVHSSESTGQNEQPHQLGAGDDCRHADDAGDPPQQPIRLVRRAREL